MAASSTSTNRNALFIAVAMGLVAAFLVGLVASLWVMTHRDAVYVALNRIMMVEKKKPELAAKARVPDDMRDVAEQASDYFARKDFDEAADCYQRIIHKYPDSLYGWSNLGVVRFQQGKLDEARVAFLQSVSLSDSDAFSWENLGITYYELRQYDDAVEALKKAVALDSNDAKSHNYLGCCYSQAGDWKLAKEEYKTAIGLDPKFGDAFFNLSLLFATATPPDIDQARVYYRQALDLGIAKDSRLERLISPDDTK
jgi:tetratricopeptide (TPR) repeat protein